MRGRVVDLRWIAAWMTVARMLAYVAAVVGLGYWGFTLGVEPLLAVPTRGDAFAALMMDAVCVLSLSVVVESRVGCVLATVAATGVCAQR
jgi:hypothetical protein